MWTNKRMVSLYNMVIVDDSCSFRKWYATEIYKNNGCDIALVQRLLQHSSAAVTQRYIGIEPQRIEKAIEGHAELI